MGEGKKIFLGKMPHCPPPPANNPYLGPNRKPLEMGMEQYFKYFLFSWISLIMLKVIDNLQNKQI